MKRRLALCVGLNYPGTDAALNGCVNDALDWREVLMERGYEARMLLEPTKAELYSELEGMVSRATFGDRIVFTYSGHGTWLPDRDGDEPDGRDEALVCKDYLNGGLLLDDEIQTIFGAARFGVRRLILSDSCHSGSVSRFVSAASRGGNAKARFMPPTEFLDGEQLERAYKAAQTPAGGVSRKGTVLISGCADTEYSYDASFAGRPNGAFTRAAIDALTPKGVSPNFREWYRQIRMRLPNGAYPQTPQLTAAPHQQRWSPL